MSNRVSRLTNKQCIDCLTSFGAYHRFDQRCSKCAFDWKALVNSDPVSRRLWHHYHALQLVSKLVLEVENKLVWLNEFAAVMTGWKALGLAHKSSIILPQRSNN